MIQFDLPKQKSSIIKVLGVGGGGSNAVNFMFQQDIEGVDFIICNTDAKAIEQSLVPNKIQLGPHLTQGLGAGADPSVGKLATEESLEEIKKILEVNTRMAFITVGMGGGTGTGGAPIIAKICKDLGILTVGIVTTPFGFEGPRRQKQAEEGINQLKPFVDTLLVISNDKLRVQYGNLKMKEAFTKADNVLATAAKCITDVINSRGHIIVDFADVCTVMKNGGVAILGKAEVEGENRAERAIEEALNSPLLNDNDIKGAKWILLNINSAEGDYECSMDELETINNILRARTGEHSDVIMGMGYDPTLGEKLGITLIATGFEHKDPFKKEEPKKAEQPVEEKIVMTLETEAPKAPESIAPEAPTAEFNETLIVEEELEVVAEEIAEPIEMEVDDYATIADVMVEAASFELEELQPTLHEYNEEVSAVFVSVPEADEENALAFDERTEIISDEVAEPVMEVELEESSDEEVYELNMETTTVDFTTEFVLQKPSNIYEETPEVAEPATSFTFEFDEVKTEQIEEPIEEETIVEETIVEETIIEEPIMETSFRMVEHTEEEPSMQLVMKEVELTNTARPAHQDFDMPVDNAEEQRRKVAERIQKLRNLSFNINNGADPNTEFDAVPAYVRRNLDLFGNTMASVENYYSKYTVEQDENNQTNISTINSFLDGKKPD
ncbi:MAG: cell division protein FtsZ [Sediminibacterium sp.]